MNENKMTKQKKQGYLPLYIAGAITLVAFISMIVVLCISNDNKVQEKFVPPAFESSAVVGSPDVPENLGYSKLYRDGMNFTAWVCGNVTMDRNNATVYLTNPADNSVWMKLRIMDADGNVLGETGLIKPGEYVESIELSKTLEIGTPVKMKIMTYEPDTYYSAGAISMNSAIGG